MYLVFRLLYASQAVGLQEYGRSLGDGTCRTAGLDGLAVAEPPCLKKPAAGLQEQAMNRKTNALS